MWPGLGYGDGGEEKQVDLGEVQQGEMTGPDNGWASGRGGSSRVTYV